LSIGERIEALMMNLELEHRDIQDLRDNIQELKALAQQDGENIRGLGRIAETHERDVGPIWKTARNVKRAPRCAALSLSPATYAE
jgi:hypothetical protein